MILRGLLPAGTAATTGTAPAAAGTTPAATALEAATASSATFRTRARFVDVDRAAAQLGSIQSRDRGLRLIRIRHFNEGEPAGLTCFPVIDDGNAFDSSILGE